LVGLVPLAIFVGIMIAGPLLASFRIHQEQQEAARKREQALLNKIASLETPPGYHDEFVRLIRLGKAISKDLLTHQQMDHGLATRSKVQSWMQLTEELVTTVFPEEVSDFLHEITQPAFEELIMGQSTHGPAFRSHVEDRLRKLEKLQK